MRRFVRFAVLSLSLAALPLFAADLRSLKEPAQIAGVFSPKEMPDLRTIDATFGEEVALAGVTLDDMLPGAKREDTAAFLDEHKIAFPNVYYTGNADALGEYLDFNGSIPITIVYDAKGKELWRHAGRLDRLKFVERLRESLRRIR
jgi:hypothetical protein